MGECDNVTETSTAPRNTGENPQTGVDVGTLGTLQWRSCENEQTPDHGSVFIARPTCVSK